MLKVVSIWSASAIDAHTFVNKYNLADRLVQFMEDHEMRGIWIVVRLSAHDLNKLVEAEGHPRLPVIS